MSEIPAHITGMGVVSAIGNSLQENHESLRLNKGGIKKASFFKSRYVEKMPFGEVNLSNEALKSLLNKKKGQPFSRTDLLAEMAFLQAIEHAELSKEALRSVRTAFLSCSTVGGMCETERLFKDATTQGVMSEYVNTWSASEHLLKIVEQYKMRGYIDCLNTACSSSINTILIGAKLIRGGFIDRAIVGGVDTLSKFTVNGFNALRILSNELCKPFDINRKGLNLGEAGAYLVLESEALLKQKKSYGVVAGFANNNDAHHPSATSDEALGPRLSMSNALLEAGLQCDEISYINAHGTGTENNDITELFGMNAVFDGSIPPFNSTKSYTGHTLAAAGALESIFSVLSLNHQEVYKSLQIDHPIMDFKATAISENKSIEINHILNNSFGFGGNCSSVIISKS